MGIAIMENSMAVSQKIKNRITIWSSNLPSGYIPQSIENRVLKRDICIPMFIAALFAIAQKWKQPKCPLMDKWINKTLSIIQS